MTNDAPPPPTGPPLPGPPATPGLSPDALLDVGDWLTDTTRTFISGFGDFFAVLTVVSLISTTVSVPLLWLGSTDVTLTRDDQGLFSGVEGMTGGQGFMVAGGLIVILASNVLLFAAATNHIDAVRAGASPRWQDTMAALVARGPRVLGVVVQIVLAAFAVLIVTGVLAGLGLGAIAGALAVAAIVLLWLRSSIAATHAALDRPGAGLAASFAWTKGRTWPLLGRHVVLLTICFGLLLIASFLSAPFQSLSGAVAPTEGDLVLRDVTGASVPAFVAVQFINALASGFVAALWAAAMLSLHRGEPPER